jgi:hypothetical protein
MRHVYRRPFDYSAPRRFFNVWRAINALEAAKGSAAFTTYAAVVSGSTVTASVSGAGASRFASAGVFRKRWNYAQNNAVIQLFYTDSQVIDGQTTQGVFTGLAATVQVGAQVPTDIGAESETVTLATYAATITQQAIQTPTTDNIGQFQTYQATITAEYGIGVSRTGPAQVKSSGTYSAGTVRGATRTPVTSTTHAITRRK